MTTTFPISDEALGASLRDLRAEAPASLGYGALVETGLADRYATIETALGPVFVAWNGLGVSWVTPAADRDDFEERFRMTVGRDVRRIDVDRAEVCEVPDVDGSAIEFDQTIGIVNADAARAGERTGEKSEVAAGPRSGSVQEREKPRVTADRNHRNAARRAGDFDRSAGGAIAQRRRRPGARLVVVRNLDARVDADGSAAGGKPDCAARAAKRDAIIPARGRVQNLPHGDVAGGRAAPQLRLQALGPG